jgi:hypothetical protein
MSQIDRLRADLAAIAGRRLSPEPARRAVQRRIAELVSAARDYYEDEPDADERVIEDLTALAGVLAKEAKALPAGPLARAYGDALDAMLAVARGG